MTIETFVKRVIAIFVTNASFLRVIANLHISTQYNMQYIPYISALFAQETLFLTQKGTFLTKDLQKVRKSQQILIRDKIAYIQA